MNEEFQKFPSTPHLAWLGKRPARADKVLSQAEAEEFLDGGIVVEEKVDGANLGLSFKDQQLKVQNRGSYLEPGAHPQFRLLWPWLASRTEALSQALQGGLVLFGEWCFAVHSIEYQSLPDWFLAFDVYDPEVRQFWASDRRNAWCGELGIACVPRLARGRFRFEQLLTLLGPSRLGASQLEGLYLRRESAAWLERRAKLVRPQFIQAIDVHWSHGALKKNHLARVSPETSSSTR